MASIREYKFEIFKNHREVQIKHAYYLLAISAAAVAFSIQQTSEKGFEFTQIPLAFAVIFWTLSFLAGCIFTRKYLDAYHENANFLELFEDEEDYCYSVEEEGKQQEQETKMNCLAHSAYMWGEVQFYSLVLGSGAFLLWHLVEMAVRT